MELNSGNVTYLLNGANPNNLVTQIDSSKYNLKDAVKLPQHENYREWVANNIFDFHKQICMLYETISGYCNSKTCPKMTAGKRYEYLWSSIQKREPVDLSASQYINHLLDWVQEQLDDEDVFPAKSDKDFPPNYLEICQTIAKRLFRVYAHIYHHHLQEVKFLKEEAHMNTSLKHFIYFVQEFRLVSPSDLDPLKDYIKNITNSSHTEVSN